MAQQGEDNRNPSIGELLQQLVDDGKNAARAELILVRAIVRYRIGQAKYGAVAVSASLILALSSVIVLLLMLAQGLARYIGPVGAGLVVSGGSAIIALMLMKFGIRRLAILAGSEEEDKALQRGRERL